MSKYNLPSAMLFAGMIFCSSAADVPVAGQSSEPVPESENGRVRIIVPSDEGIVTGKAIIQAIAETANLESDEIPTRSLRDGIDLNDPAARLTLLLIGAAIPDVRLQIDDQDAQSPALVVSIDVEKIGHRARSVKRTIRHTLQKDSDIANGLSEVTFPEDSDANVVVVLLHGFESSTQSMKDLESFLLSQHWPVAQFQYSGDGQLMDSVSLLHSELNELKDRYPDREIVLVTHSMGGIVARGVVELPEYANPHVARLIMVAPPNHGSQWARLPADFDGRDTLDRKARNALRMTQIIADHLNKARADLNPRSTYLQKLNQCPRAAGVDYSIIAGTAGPVTADEYDSLRAHLNEAARDSDESELRPLLSSFAENLDEIVAERGDGVVSVASARLEGVEDFVTLPMRHTQIDGSSQVTQELFEEINRRIRPQRAE